MGYEDIAVLSTTKVRCKNGYVCDSCKKSFEGDARRVHAQRRYGKVRCGSCQTIYREGYRAGHAAATANPHRRGYG